MKTVLCFLFLTKKIFKNWSHLWCPSSSIGQVLIGGLFLDHYSFYGSCMLLCVLSVVFGIASFGYLWKADLTGRLEYSTETEPLNQSKEGHKDDRKDTDDNRTPSINCLVSQENGNFAVIEVNNDFSTA